MKLKTSLRRVWKCCSDALQIGSTIFRRSGTLGQTRKDNRKVWTRDSMKTDFNKV